MTAGAGIILWDYPKSSASYRVRIALNLAGLSYRTEQVDLLEGAQRASDHLARNPQGLVPVLEMDGLRLTQSLAIVEYLDETRSLGLLPADAGARAAQRALAHAIAVDVHPVCNLSVMRHATGGQEPARTEWMQHFIGPALAAFEVMLRQHSAGPFAGGERPGLADLCLIPQLYNARRWGVDYGTCVRIKEVEAACEALPAFAAAHPDRCM